MSKTFVSILMGSDSDLPTLNDTIDVLKKFEIAFEVKIASAHRTPLMTQHYVYDAEKRGCAVFIAAAGLAAHLAGAVAANTTKPVIGIPIEAGSLNGLDALLSTVQMPGGIPVATVAIGKPGAKNAGYLAAQILAINNEAIHNKLIAEREKNQKDIQAKNEQLSALSALRMTEIL
jgi:5-(carboxyamino)imidazole ribonucleotide mutase